MSDRTHHIEVKSLFRADDFLAFRQACDESDVSRSRMLVKLARWWLAWKKSTEGHVAMELPEPGQIMAMFRAYYGGTPFPLLI